MTFTSSVAQRPDYLTDQVIPRLNQEIYQLLSSAKLTPLIHELALIINPFGKTAQNENYPKKVNSYLQVINQLQQLDPFFLKQNQVAMINQCKLLFLLTQQYLLQSQVFHQRVKKHHKIPYALKLVTTLPYSKERCQLEDFFFRSHRPKISQYYAKYRHLLIKNFKNEALNIKQSINEELQKARINSRIKTRIKSAYSIYQKVNRKKISYNQIYDVIGFRIITNSINDCYQVFNLLIKKWSVLHNKVKDYIAVPKKNGYQSIHLTTLINKVPFEMQIRTKKMEEFAEKGPAQDYHLKYE